MRVYIPNGIDFNLQIGVGWALYTKYIFNLHGGYIYFSTKKLKSPRTPLVKGSYVASQNLGCGLCRLPFLVECIGAAVVINPVFFTFI